MSTITLPNIRVSSDLTVKVRLKDGGVAIDWSTLSNVRALIYSDAQRAMAGRCAVTVDAEDATLLVCQYAANKPQYIGVNRIVISATYLGEMKTYDKPALNFVRWTDDQAGQEITISDPDVEVEIEVEDVSSSILQEAVDAAFSAAERAEEAAAAAEHMVDIHTGPAGKSPYIGENGNWFEWDETTHQYVDTEEKAKGDTGETPDITIGTVTTVEPGTPAAATMTGTPEAPVLNLTIPKGVAGDTPAFTVGEVTTGEPGTPVVVTITGTAAAPVLNVTIPQGLQGNTGSSVDYPYELVNNLTTNDATKGLSAAQGKVLKDEITQLEHEIDNIQNEIAPDGIRVYDLTLLRDLRVSDQGSGNIKITSNADGYLYYAKVKSGAVVSIAFSIPSGAYYRRGFTTSIPTLNVTGVGYTAKASTAVDDSYTAPSDGYIVVDCASGFNSLSMTSPIAGDTIGKEVAQLQSDLADAEEDIATIDGAVYQNVTKNGKVLAGVVYSLSVGNAPTAGTSSWYNAVRASGLGRGDTIHIRARAGSSYPTWAKLLNGVVVWASEALVDVDETITCDGAFDEIITNSYNSYVANPYCTIVHKATAFEIGGQRELRVLAIGNSFSEDSIGYIPGIIKKICPNLKLTIGIAYMGGSPLAQHLAYFTGNTITLAGKTYRTNNGEYQRVDENSGTVEFSGLYTFYKSVDGDAWTSAQATVQQFLDNEDWDIITFQQNGTNVNSDWDTYYAPYIYALQKSLYGKITYPTRLGWVLVHGAYGNSHAENLTKWEGGAVNAEKVMEKTGCSILIPYGTAIQNLRTTTLASLGDGDAHDLLADTAHLQDGIGPLAASYTYILAIARAMGMPVGVIGDNTRPDEAFLTQYNVPGQNIGDGMIGITDANCFLAQVAADKAVTNPYEVTDLSVFQS